MSNELSAKLGYTFSDPKLFKKALTHRSSENENNERLEFLGDSIVNFVIADLLYQQFPHAQEGELSRWRASLVNRDTLGEIARNFGIGPFLILGPGELKNGGGERLSILSCAIEAIIGAIYLDGGFVAVRDCLVRWYQPLLASVSPKSMHKDPKTQLQEYLQSHRLSLPTYQLASVAGEPHNQTFVVHCSVPGLAQTAVGNGTSRRRAEQDAAAALLRTMKNE